MEKRCYGCMEIKYSSPICEHCGFDEGQENASHQLQLGTILRGQYLVGKVLGQGGFGITYLGWDLNLETPIAIKEFFPRGSVGRDSTQSALVFSYNRENDPAFEASKKRFLREAQTLAKLESIPQVVRIRNFFEDNNTAYIVMEYIQGQNLREYVEAQGGRVPAAVLLSLLKPTMEALMKVHEAGLVHRDISPDNIMLLPDGSTKLLDFGAVRQVEHAGVEKALTHSTQAILKHGFAPIEQYQSKGSLGPWTDVYALCGTIYYCLTGQIPPEAGERIMEGEELAWDQVPGLSRMQREALIKGTALLPKERTTSIKALYEGLFAEELERLRRKQQEERERLERERLERERLERERLEKERLERERLEKERQRQEKLEQQERQKQERLRLKREKQEQERQKRRQKKEAQEQQEREKQERRNQERKQQAFYTAELTHTDMGKTQSTQKQEGTIVLTGIGEIPKPPKKKNRLLPVLLVLMAIGGLIAVVSGNGKEEKIEKPGVIIQPTETESREETTIPTEAPEEPAAAVIVRTGDTMMLNSGNVRIRVEEGTKFTVTLSGLELQDSYVTNFASSEANTSDYYWRVGMHFDSEQETGYAVRTMCLADNPGQENSVSLADMGHTLSRQTERYKETTLDGKVTMTHADSSITWTFDTSQEPDFRFEDVKLLSVSTYDIRKGEENAYTSYTIPVSGVEDGMESVELAQNGNVKEIKGSNLHIRVENDKHYTVTLSGLDIKNSYTKNLPDSSYGQTEYSWHVNLYTGGEDSLAYGIWTNCNAFDPGNEKTVTIDSGGMWSAVMEKKEGGNSWSNVMDISMTHTKTSITWKFTLPDSLGFRLEDVARVETSCLDVSNLENPYSVYNYSLDPDMQEQDVGDRRAVIRKSGNIMEAKWDNLHILVKNDREFTATLTGLDIRDSYEVNQPTSKSGYGEYVWSLSLGDYRVETGYWAMSPGNRKTITMAEMYSSFLKSQGVGNPLGNAGDVKMSWTKDSITWNFTMPEDADFRFEELDHVGLLITDVAKNPESFDYYTYYLDKDSQGPNPDAGTTMELSVGTVDSVGNVDIQVKNGKDYTVTMTGLDLQDSYKTNLSSTVKNRTEYAWQVSFYTKEDKSAGYSVATATWAFDPGKNESKTIDQMQHNVWFLVDGTFEYANVENFRMTHTKDTITWTFTLPADSNYRLEDVKTVEVAIVDVANPQNGSYTIYSVTEIKKTHDP